MGKTIDTIKMAFNTDNEENADKAIEAPQVVPEEELESKEFNGKTVYKRNKSTGDVKYYDTNGKEVSVGVVQKLEEVNVSISEFSETGAEKEGDLEVREVDYKEQGKENVQGETKFIAERQKYKDGNSWTATIPKNLYDLVKFLR